MIPSLVLPYIVPHVDRVNPYTNEMETAALLCFAEAQRKKGRLLTAEEKLSFLSKLHYPLWAFPWNNKCLIVDGLGQSNYTFTRMNPSNIDVFTEHVKQSARDRGLYRRMVQNHLQTFKEYVSETPITVPGIIAERALLSAIHTYVTTIHRHKPRHTPALIRPTSDEPPSRDTIDLFLQNLGQNHAEIKGLQYATEVLEETTRFQTEKIQIEISQTNDSNERTLSSVKSQVKEKIDKISRERDNKHSRLFQKYGKELKRKRLEKTKIEKELEKLELKRVEYKQRQQTRRRRRDKIGEARWKYRRKESEKKISKVKKKLDETVKTIKRLDNNLDGALQQLSNDYQKLIDQEHQRVNAAEAAWTAEIQKRQREQNELVTDTSAIATQIKRLIDRKRQHTSRLEQAAIPWEPAETTIVYIPFYLANYQRNTHFRFKIHAPAMAMDHRGTFIKLRKTFRAYNLESRLNLLLHPMSDALDKMFTTILPARMKTDKALRDLLDSCGVSNNLLNLSCFARTLRKGLDDLRQEGWIKPEEKDEILSTYA